jgi:hypothetical protein
MLEFLNPEITERKIKDLTSYIYIYKGLFKTNITSLRLKQV